MASGGRKERREAKLKDIMQDAGGNIVYTGDLWRISEDGGPGPGRRVMHIAGLALLTVMIVGSGCIDAKNATGAFYVVLPFIGEVSALFGLAWNAVKVLLPGSGVRTYELQQASGRIPAACRLLMIFALVGLALSVLYLVLNGAGGNTADGIAYLMLKLASAATAEWYRRLFRAAAWEKVS